ncbi:uncharacterized protein LOC121376969 [Gigantopelta aegis]|uniref:uncharacterized protein LOC121376969 n=1 Tax=Gigantopelta aegis TaxID=1735272 RepID=UPI001B888340|nr:uncharacterized protein LOC121376969 [Gigantopelta aegis]
MSSVGFGYTRTEVLNIATDLAVHLGKRETGEKPFSLRWFYGFMKRWPELRVQKPRSLEIMRAKATSKDTINKYFDSLEQILDKYDLRNSPESIYNIDEKGIVENHKPPSIVASRSNVPVAVTTSRSNTTTVIGCGNALGVAIPPYFVFKGKRMREELLAGCTAGTAGTVSETGWSNTGIFQKYLKEHFSKYVPAASSDKPVLILYDGHTSHINVSLIQWARERHIILFVLPAHTSHVLQPMDVGCFGPFERIYNGMRHTYIREHATSGIDRHSLCETVCKAYCAALTPANLQSSFRKTGIYPFHRDVIQPSTFLPSAVLSNNMESENESQTRATVNCEDNSSKCKTFFTTAEEVITRKPKPTKKRKVLSAVVSGKAITEDLVLEDIREHQKNKQNKEGLQKRKCTKSKKTEDSPKPSTSGILFPPSANTKQQLEDEDDTSEESDDPSDLCCKCKKSQPDEYKHCVSLCFVSWAQCTYPACQHWVHLKFCTPVRVVRRHSEFWCPCHNGMEE